MFCSRGNRRLQNEDGSTCGYSRTDVPQAAPRRWRALAFHPVCVDVLDRPRVELGQRPEVGTKIASHPASARSPTARNEDEAPDKLVDAASGCREYAHHLARTMATASKVLGCEKPHDHGPPSAEARVPRKAIASVLGDPDIDLPVGPCFHILQTKEIDHRQGRDRDVTNRRTNTNRPDEVPTAAIRGPTAQLASGVERAGVACRKGRDLLVGDGGAKSRRCSSRNLPSDVAQSNTLDDQFDQR